MAVPGATLHLRILTAVPRLEDPYGIEIEFPRGKALALLGYLGLQEEPVSRDHLANLFWPGVDALRQRGSLRQALWAIRNRLGTDVLVGEDPIRVAPGAIVFDLETFHGRLKADDLAGAMALWTAPPFGDLQVGQAPDWDRWKDRLQMQERERLADRLTQEAGDILARLPSPTQGGPPYSDPVYLLRLAIHVQPGRLRRYEALVQVLLERRWLDEARQIIEEGRSVLADPRSKASLDSLEAQRQLLERRLLPEEKRDRSIRLPFCGRSDELGQLLEQWRSALQGMTGVTVILGESGVGKTRLAHEIQTVAEREGGRTVQVKGEATESPPIWGLLNELVSQLLQLSGAGGISPETDATLRNLGVEGDPAADSGRAQLRGPRLHPSLALTDAVLDLISAVTEDAPLFLLVDDLHWSDGESRSVLARVVARLPDQLPLQWLFCSWDRDELGRAATTVEQIEAPAISHTTRLMPWSYPVMRDALQTRITFRGDLELGKQVLKRIHAVTRGNPLFVLEILTVFAEEGIVAPQGEHFWSFDVAKVPENLPLPASVRALVERHLGQLSSEGLQVATALARLGRPASPRKLGMRSGLRESEVTGALGELLTRRMIRWTDGGSVDFLHDELRSAILLQFEDHVGLTSGGGKPWSMFRTLALGSGLLLALSGVVFFVAGPERMARGPWDGGTVITTRGSAFPRAFVLHGVAGLTIREVTPPDLESLKTFDPVRVIPDSGGAADNLQTPGEAILRYRIPLAGDEVELGRLPLPISRIRVAPNHGSLAVLSGPEPGILHVFLGGKWHTSQELDVEVLDMDWCGSERLLVLGRRLGASGLWEWRPGQPESPRLLDLGPVRPGASLACAPNGNAVLLAGAQDGTGGLFLFNIQSRSITRLSTGPDYVVPDRIEWIATRNPDGPTGLKIAGVEGDTLTLGKGAQVPLRTFITRASGRDVEVQPRWQVDHPDVVEVRGPGVLQALKPGETRLQVAWGIGLLRTLTLIVGDDPDPALLAELPGDVPVTDGVVATPVFAFPDGAGVSVEGRIRWQDDERLRLPPPAPIRICLKGVRTQQEACVRIRIASNPQDTATMATDRDASDGFTVGVISLTTDPFFPPVRVVLDPAWTRWIPNEPVRELRLLLSMAADGSVALALGGSIQLEAPIRLQPNGEDRWQAVLEGQGRGTDQSRVWIHTLRAWEGRRW